MSDLDALTEELLKDPEFRKEFEKQKVENEGMTVDEMLELVETIDKAILPLGYEVITGHEDEEDGTFNLVLIKREDDEE